MVQVGCIVESLWRSTCVFCTVLYLADSHQFVLCTVAVGRSFVQDDPTAKKELPAGYDSLYLHSGDNAAVEGLPVTNGGDAYRHTYVVFESAQILPRYIVHFSYSPRERLHRQPVKPINLAEIKEKVAETLALLGPAAPAATEKMLSDIGKRLMWCLCGCVSRVFRLTSQSCR